MHAIATPSELSVSISEVRGRDLITADDGPSTVDPNTGAHVYRLRNGVVVEFHKARTVVRGSERALREVGI